MIFTSPAFVVFALIFFGAWFASPARLRKPLLLLASYAFYAHWNLAFTALLAGSTILDFWVGHNLGRTDDPVLRRRLVTASLVGNLGALGTFKYFNFFAEAAADLVAVLGLQVSGPTLDVLLPVGISFYTFQSLSYTIDIYRRQMQPTSSFVDFASYVAFFPQLVAGPIERATHLLPQIRDVATAPTRWSGLTLIALGAFKKAVIADNVGLLVDQVYSSPDQSFPLAMWVGTYAFAVQIYCDFSGYSDIAIGLGRLVGVELRENFRSPYAAADPSEFWRRWHISLSSWLRDYLYIPLGGNRLGPARRYINLAVTMLLGGLWHGAAWNFVLWGAFHGALLVVYRHPFAERLRAWAGERRPLQRRLLSLSARLSFFHLVCLGWAMFRAQSLNDVGIVLRKLLDPTGWHPTVWLAGVADSGYGGYIALFMVVLVLMLLAQNLRAVGSKDFAQWIAQRPLPVRVAFVAGALYAAMVLSPAQPPPFIYFQF